MARSRGVLGTGVLCGLAAAAGWLALVAVERPVPPDAVLATLAALCGALAAVVLHRREATARLRAGLVAAITTCLVVPVVVEVVSHRGDSSWVPGIVTQALSPAANVRESRVEMVDPYVALWAFAVLLAGALVVVSSTRVRAALDRWFAPAW